MNEQERQIAGAVAKAMQSPGTAQTEYSRTDVGALMAEATKLRQRAQHIETTAGGSDGELE